jgi:hypothetical protein
MIVAGTTSTTEPRDAMGWDLRFNAAEAGALAAACSCHDWETIVLIDDDECW